MIGNGTVSGVVGTSNLENTLSSDQTKADTLLDTTLSAHITSGTVGRKIYDIPDEQTFIM